VLLGTDNRDLTYEASPAGSLRRTNTRKRRTDNNQREVSGYRHSTRARPTLVSAFDRYDRTGLTGFFLGSSGAAPTPIHRGDSNLREGINAPLLVT
jgi:hypothetical protein